MGDHKWNNSRGARGYTCKRQEKDLSCASYGWRASKNSTYTTTSKVYWESGIPIITYGVQVTRLKYTEIAKIEKTHQEVSRLIQGLPEQTPACASLRTIGWKSVQACIDLIRMLFFWKILCMKTNVV